MGHNLAGKTTPSRLQLEMERARLWLAVPNNVQQVNIQGQTHVHTYSVKYECSKETSTKGEITASTYG